MIEKKTIKARAPLRIGLSGGGTDIEDYYSKYNGAVINSTICLYAYVQLKDLNSDVLRVEALDYNVSQEWDITENKTIIIPKDRRLQLL